MKCKLKNNTLIVDGNPLFEYETEEDWNDDLSPNATFYDINFISSCFTKYNNEEYWDKDIYLSFDKNSANIEIYVAEQECIDDKSKESFEYPFYQSKDFIKNLSCNNNKQDNINIKKLELGDEMENKRTRELGTLYYIDYDKNHITVCFNNGHIYWDTDNPNNYIIKEQNGFSKEYAKGALTLDFLKKHIAWGGFGYVDKHEKSQYVIMNIEVNHVWLLDCFEYDDEGYKWEKYIKNCKNKKELKEVKKITIYF